jgi:hypothetical protein
MKLYNIRYTCKFMRLSNHIMTHEFHSLSFSLVWFLAFRGQDSLKKILLNLYSCTILLEITLALFYFKRNDYKLECKAYS